MSTDRAISLALIVVELLTNAIKYAYPGSAGSIWVTITTQSDDVVISIRDHGRGLPDGFDVQAHAGFGMRIVRALASQLEGTVVPVRHERGAEFVVRAPILVAPTR
jgi:two-component sensor histidine kinase